LYTRSRELLRNATDEFSWGAGSSRSSFLQGDGHLLVLISDLLTSPRSSIGFSVSCLLPLFLRFLNLNLEMLRRRDPVNCNLFNLPFRKITPSALRKSLSLCMMLLKTKGELARATIANDRLQIIAQSATLDAHIHKRTAENLAEKLVEKDRAISAAAAPELSQVPP
jgi:hypothetical protein